MPLDEIDQNSPNHLDRSSAAPIPARTAHSQGESSDAEAPQRSEVIKQDDQSPPGSKVSVVYWTDKILGPNRTWPLHMEEHAHVLEGILAFRPKAVLVDIFFPDDPEKRGDMSFDELRNVIGEYREREDTALYFLESEEETTGKLQLNREKEVIGAALSHSPTRTYRADGAAVAVWKESQSDLQMETREFQLFWPGRPSGITEAFWKCDAVDFPDNILGVAKKVFQDLVSDRDSNGNPCPPYIPAIPADVMACMPPVDVDDERVDDSMLEKRAASCMPTDGKDTPTRKMVEKALKDKFVIYGASLTGLGDVYRTPVSGDKYVPGLFIHAIALDNRLELHGKHGNVHSVKPSLFEDLPKHIFAALIATLSFFLTCRALFIWWHGIENCITSWLPDNKYAHLIRDICLLVLELLYWGFTVFLIGMLVLWLTWGVFILIGVGVANWLAVMLVSGGLTIWAKKPFADKVTGILTMICQILNHTSNLPKNR